MQRFMIIIIIDVCLLLLLPLREESKHFLIFFYYFPSFTILQIAVIYLVFKTCLVNNAKFPDHEPYTQTKETPLPLPLPLALLSAYPRL